jgi:hypothetical protein
MSVLKGARMSKAIKITAGKIQVEAELNDKPTAKAVAEELPIKGVGNRWGGEIYFAIAVTAELEEDSRHRKGMKLERHQT